MLSRARLGRSLSLAVSPFAPARHDGAGNGEDIFHGGEDSGDELFRIEDEGGNPEIRVLGCCLTGVWYIVVG